MASSLVLGNEQYHVAVQCLAILEQYGAKEWRCWNDMERTGVLRFIRLSIRVSLHSPPAWNPS